jgi:hypothetical protein
MGHILRMRGWRKKGSRLQQPASSLLSLTFNFSVSRWFYIVFPCDTPWTCKGIYQGPEPDAFFSRFLSSLQKRRARASNAIKKKQIWKSVSLRLVQASLYADAAHCYQTLVGYYNLCFGRQAFLHPNRHAQASQQIEAAKKDKESVQMLVEATSKELKAS